MTALGEIEPSIVGEELGKEIEKVDGDDVIVEKVEVEQGEDTKGLRERGAQLEVSQEYSVGSIIVGYSDDFEEMV